VTLSTDPNDRAIAGNSSGAIAAVAAAWNRPDAFRRVFSAIGTYVGRRGGNELPVLIRKTEPKPLRVFLQDGMYVTNGDKVFKRRVTVKGIVSWRPPFKPAPPRL
jgi:hypothetical protein